MNIIPLYHCQFCQGRVFKKELTHDGKPTHASCLFAHIATRSILGRIQRQSLQAHRCVTRLEAACS